MKLSSSNLSLALGACFLLHSRTASAATTCNADNCIRALFPIATPAAVSSAVAFCSIYTTTINTATTGFPTRATAACGSSSSRYSSACSCRPTPSCTPNSLIKNGGFECGLTPWTAQDIVNSTHTLSSPGDTSNTAFEFTQVGLQDPRGNPNTASLAQNIPELVDGAGYTLVFSLFFNAGSCTPQNGFLGVKIGANAVFIFRPCDQGQAAVGQFYRVVYTFTMDTGPKFLRFEFLCSRPGTVVKIDNVAITPA